jgi:hypothetical protein
MAVMNTGVSRVMGGEDRRLVFGRAIPSKLFISSRGCRRSHDLCRQDPSWSVHGGKAQLSNGRNYEVSPLQ